MKTTIFITIFIFCVAIIFAACNTKKGEKTVEKTPKPAEKTSLKPVEPPNAFFQAWLHSREEDKEGVKNLRPTDGSFQFPPSRGRYGYIFEKGGKGSMTYPGPTDATDKKPLTWAISEHHGARLLTLVIKESETTNTTQTYIIVEMTDKIIQLSEFKK